MAIQLIQSTDTLESGFRVKANNNFNEIIESITTDSQNGQPLYNGKYRFVKNGGGFIYLDLSDQFYTKTQVAQLLAQATNSPYSGAWSSVSPYQAQSIVDNAGRLWRSNSANNSETPGSGTKWDLVLSYQAITSGTDEPLPADGNVGDEYIKSDGSIYQKSITGWGLVATLPSYTPPSPYIDFVNPGDNMPKSFSLPARFNNRFGIKFDVLLPVSGGSYFSDTNGATMTYQTLWVDNTYNTVNRVDIYGAPDGLGKFADKFMFTVYAL